MAQAANIPTPRLYLVPNQLSPNAFATGRSPQHAAVAATTGIMKTLSREELAGVMAHEIAHVTARHGVVQLRKQRTAQASVGVFRVID